MVPAGAAHIIRPSISLAAQFAGIDYADAVTGFDFVRNKASARVNGIIVAQENVEGLLEVWEGMMERVRGEEERRRVHGVMERWRRFLVGMGIRRRLEETHGKVEDENVVVDEDDGNDDLGGGFLRGAVQDGRGFGDGFGSASRIMTAEMTTTGEAQSSGQQEYSSEMDVTMRNNGDDDEYRKDGPDNEHDLEMDDDLSGGFEKDNDVQMEEEAKGGGFIHDDIKDGQGEGFVQETSDSEGGGFIYDDEDGIL
jgi:xeroderma pigmentosum group C-complementing protein